MRRWRRLANIPVAEVSIIVPGRAVSSQARTAGRYKQRIHELARPLFPEPLTERNIRVQVDYFYTTGHIVDLDNLLKCVLDGLNNAAYVDDVQVEEVLIRRYNIFMTNRILTPREEWLPHIRQGADFVSIIVSEIDY